MTLKTSLVISGDAADATSALTAAEAALTKVEQAARQATAATNQIGPASATSLGQARAGYTQLGQQFQDIAIQLQMGTNLGTIIAQQGGQVASAVQMMGGRLSGLAGFLAGPWGAALTVGAGVLVNFGIELFRSGDAAGAAAAGWQDARNEAEKLIDSLKRLSALQKEGIDLDVTRAQIRRNQIVDRLSELESTMARRPKRQNGEAMFSYRELTEAKELKQELLGVNAAIGLGNRELQRREELEKKRSREGGSRVRTSRRSGDAGAFARAEFGEDTAAKIARIRDQFSDMPTGLQRANQAMRQLDDLTSDVARKGGKLVDGPKLIAEIGSVRRVIQDSLNKPFEEFMQKQRESAAIDRLLLQGREAEAEALRIVLQLQERQGPLSKQQLEAVLATVEAERQRGMVLRDQRALIQANLDAVYDMRGALEATFADALRGKFSFSNILSSLGNSWINLTAKRLVEDMFGSTLRALEDQATGADKVDAAGQQMATSLGKAGSAVDSFAAAVSAASGSVRGALGGGFSPGLGGANAGASQVASTVARAVSAVMGSRQSVAGAATVEADGSLTVTGGRQRTVRSRPDDLNLVVDMASQVFGQFGIKVPKAITDLTKNFLGRLETSLPEVMKGAMIGSAGASLILGQGGNNAGSVIGGAFGESLLKQAAPSLFKSLGDFAGPLGSLAGGLIGGLVGKLFSSAKWGTAVVGQRTATGNNDQMRAGSTGAANSIQSAIERIAEAFGASVGGYSVSIGQMDGKWRVSTTGRTGKLENKYKDVTNFGKEGGEAAFAFALSDAIADGAIQGVSAAIQKALRSSSDVDKAVREAMKVQEVELAIGGIGAQLDKAFKDFERQAAERLRIAREYGFDVVKLEELNAKDRLKLTQKLLDDQVGSLQSLIDEMTSGGLFEGSSVDRRQALLDKIGVAKAAADAGEEGAADRLAELLQQLNAVSKEVFGTTGGFAGDRNTILDAARDTIARANQRITDAQKASDPALALTNAALDENNGQNAQIIALLGDMNARLAQLRQAGGFAGDTLSALARTS